MENRCDDMKNYSLADELVSLIDVEWEVRKERGNICFKAGRLQEAIKHYTDALHIALGPFSGGGLKAFTQALESRANSASQLIPNEIILHEIFSFLPSIPANSVILNEDDIEGKKPMTLKKPNKPAAIALANRSAAKMAEKNFNGALKDGLRAAKLCPEYVKAHHRILKAYQALGDNDNAKDKSEEIKDFEATINLFPFQALPLLCAGWITWEEALVIYLPANRKEAARRIIASLGPTKKTIGITCSLVPFQGGQHLLIGARYTVGGEICQRKIDCIDFGICDNENEEMLNELPHGRASEISVSRVLNYVSQCIVCFKKLYGLEIVHVLACQGLVEVVNQIKLRLVEDGLGHVTVTRSVSTRVSEDAGIFLPFEEIVGITNESKV